MRVIETVAQFQEWRRELEADGLSLGFVPTMGALHNGHLSLVRRARAECDRSAMSIFVNPTQFNDPSDLEKYPRPLENDLRLARDAGVDAVFLPQAAELYADHYRFQLHEAKLTKILCGAARPGHFDGVLTVVLKLFMITRPARAYFGEKDYQQFLLIREMAGAFFLTCQVIGLPTVREPDGLAMSSRNLRLSERDRRLAPRLYQELKSGLPLEEIQRNLRDAGFRVEYVEEHFGRRLAAVFLGNVRLIDNV